MREEGYTKRIVLFVIVLFIFALFRTTLGIHSDEVHSIAVGDMIEEGNIFFKECWFYLQMSAVFSAPLIHIYKIISGGTEGILIFFRIVSVIVQLLVSIFFYKTFSKDYNKKFVLAAAIAFFVYIPDFQSFNYKQEFIWFSLLEIILIYRYYRSRRSEYLILLAVTIAFNVLAYPTAIIQFFVYAFLVFYIEKKEYKRETGVQKVFLFLVVPCIVCAICFMVWVLKDISLAEFWKYFFNVFKDENLNDSFISKLGHPIKKFFLLGIMSLLPLGLVLRIDFFKKMTTQYKLPIMTVVLWGAFLLQAYIERKCITWHCITYPYSLLVFWIPVVCCRKNREKSVSILLFFELPAVVSILIMALASNQGNITSMYGMVIAMMGFLLLLGEDDKENGKEYVNESKICCISIVLMALFIFAFPIYEQESVTATNVSARTIFTERTEVKTGPAKGMFLGEESFEKYSAICSLVDENVNADDKLFIIDDYYSTAFGYLTSVGEYATFSPQGGWGLATSDRAVHYFNENPQKTPTIVIVNLDYVAMPISEYMKNSPTGNYLKNNKYRISSEEEKYVVLRK